MAAAKANAKGQTARAKKPKPMTAKDRLKLSIAEQLGLLEKIKRDGWGGLSAQECGQVGGLISSLLKESKDAELRQKALGNPRSS